MIQDRWRERELKRLRIGESVSSHTFFLLWYIFLHYQQANTRLFTNAGFTVTSVIAVTTTVEDQLSAGIIAGIVVGSLVGVVLISVLVLLAVYLLCFKWANL